MSKDENNEIIKCFVEESIEIIDDVVNNLGVLEDLIKKNQFDNKIINSIFRSFHSLKGSSAYLDFSIFSGLTHKIESLLDGFRKGKLKFDFEYIKLFHIIAELIKKALLDILEDKNDLKFESEAKMLSNYIDDILYSDVQESKILDQTRIKKLNENLFKYIIKNNKKITPVLSQFLNLELEEILDSIERLTLKLDTEENKNKIIDDLFIFIQVFKSNASLLGYITSESLGVLASNILNKLKKNTNKNNKDFMNILFYIIDILKNEMQIKEFLLNKGISFENLDVINQFINTSILSDIDAEEQIGNKLELTDFSNVFSDTKFNKSMQKNLGVRVDLSSINEIITIIDELIIEKAKLFKEIKTEIPTNQLDYIINKLQNIVLSMRMVTLENIFNRMKRLINVLCDKTNKIIELEIKGSEIRVDKNIIEEITDPIMHIIRNSIDHGIENKEDRKKIGKNEKAKIEINATEKHGEIIIKIKDDGAGLNKEKIIDKAISKKLIDENQKDKLSDHDIYNFIFLAGFSTKQETSELSGRGVGLDVVKKNIENLNGQIEISSEKNKGCTFILRIPTRFIYGMQIKIGDENFIIPLAAIIESFTLDKKRKYRIDNELDAIKFREEIYPFYQISDILKIDGKNFNTNESQIGIIVKTRNEEICLAADQVVTIQQFLIKDIPKSFGKIDKFIGCSILTDGDICLILNIDRLII